VSDKWIPADACTLPTAERPLRVAEFDTLFATALRAVERPAPDRLRLELDAAAAASARQLVARETRCCSFFDFRFTAADDRLLLDVRVPASRIDVLDGLARRAGA
jgi:hypothetical protein